jgi:hypothetical protein
VSKRLVPLAAARLRHETNLRIALLAKVAKLSTELHAHLQCGEETGLPGPVEGSIDEAIATLETLVETVPFKLELQPKPEGT